MCGFTSAVRINKSSSLDFGRLIEGFQRIKHRGPDQSRIEMDEDYFFAFHRLAIMDRRPDGMQPFLSEDHDRLLVCNGEIYNFEALKDIHVTGHQFKSKSDCEVILPLIDRIGITQTVSLLEGEFAFVFYDRANKRTLAARDPMGIRPLFYGYDADDREKAGWMFFASEAKALQDLCKIIEPFPPGYYFDGNEFRQFRSYCGLSPMETTKNIAPIVEGIRKYLVAAVEKRLHADVPIGFLLSGGLDSSLVCAIAARSSKVPIKTFAIGTATDAIDLKYAKQVADHIGSQHQEVFFSKSDVLRVLHPVIFHLESWDITTVRASIGMYLVCEWIRNHSSCKVLLSGEVSDELFGYKYTDFAPSSVEFQAESEKRVRELYMYDVLRADRCIAAHGLEARVPFSDCDFVDFVMRIPAELKMNHYGIGKHLLREAFKDGNYLPESLRLREKAAFSDAVGHSMVDDLKSLAEEKISDADFAASRLLYKHGIPMSKEALMYRRIFDEFYPDRAAWIEGFWLPNRNWKHCNVDDPSARVLPNYGKSAL